MTNEIAVALCGQVATVAINRPEKLNAMTLDMYRAFGAAFEELGKNDRVRCIVVQGTGERAFCTGSDISEFGSSRLSVDQAKAYAVLANGATDKLRYCRHPTVAKIVGLCVGGGLEIASMCDIRICSTESRFGLPANRIGLTVDYEELDVLCELVGRRAALEILLEGRIFGADEALRLQLVSRVVDRPDLDDEVDQTAERIAERAPLSNRWHKAFVRRLADPRPVSAAEREEAYQCFLTEDYREGTTAFREKRKPQFVGR
jgi:enoyl-CoA hydratase